MKTAVQLRAGGAVQCELACGTPSSSAAGALGPVALFGPDEVVAYVIRTPSGRRLFLFRTLAVDDKWAARLPGVHPHVRLLVHVRSAMRVRAMRRLLGYIAKRAVCPSHLSDAFYVRVSHALGGRTDQARLRLLLRRELARREGQRAGDATAGRS
jgi:hypothetical protein